MQNLSGGNVAVQTGSWNKWATVEERSGNRNDDYGQSKYPYTTRIIMRYEKERPTRSNDTIDYEGTRYEITSVRVSSEARSQWEICEVQKIDNGINSDSPVETDNIKVLNFTGTNGEDGYTFSVLVGANVFGAFKDGVQYKVITSGAVNTNEKEVLFDAGTGVLTWSIPFGAGEKATIQYY